MHVVDVALAKPQGTYSQIRSTSYIDIIANFRLSTSIQPALPSNVQRPQRHETVAAMTEYKRMDPFSFAGSKDVDHPVSVRMYGRFLGCQASN